MLRRADDAETDNRTSGVYLTADQIHKSLFVSGFDSLAFALKTRK